MEVAGMLKWRNWLYINRWQNVVVFSNMFESGIRHVAFIYSAGLCANIRKLQYNAWLSSSSPSSPSPSSSSSINNQHAHPVHLLDDELRLIIFIITSNASGHRTGKTYIDTDAFCMTRPCTPWLPDQLSPFFKKRKLLVHCLGNGTTQRNRICLALLHGLQLPMYKNPLAKYLMYLCVAQCRCRW